MPREQRVLVVDADHQRRNMLKIVMEFLGEAAIIATPDGWRTQARSPKELLAVILGDCSGEKKFEQCLSELHQWAEGTPIVLINQDRESLNDPDLKQAILTSLVEPLSYSQVLNVLHRCQIVFENYRASLNKGSERSPVLFRSMVGASPVIQQVRRLIEQVAEKEDSILLLGESGTGKEVAARNIHNQSKRCDKPFVPVNCGAIPPNLLESELFGAEKDAVIGALSAIQGRFELAQGGTLFLDDISDLPLPVQAKILQVLQAQCFERVGGNCSIEVDIRIIAAADHPLEDQIKVGSFSKELFHHLNFFPIEMPALRDRREDISLLINELIARIEGSGRGTVRLLPSAIEVLCQYNWPGNVRELANLIERLVMLYPGGMIDVTDLPAKFRQDVAMVEGIPNSSPLASLVADLPSECFDLKAHLIETEVFVIKQVLENSNWIVARAAQYLCMRRTTLVEKMRKYQIERPERLVEEQ